MDPPLAESQFRALVSLLADRDESIVRRCKERLLTEPERARAFLDEAASSADLAVASAAARTLHELRARIVDGEIAAFAADPSEWLDLETGAILVARTGDPDLDIGALRGRLDELGDAVRGRVLIPDDVDDVSVGLRSVLAEEAGLRGNGDDYYDPANSFLHRVLERRVGIPISLSVIYLLVARRAGLDVAGVGMPGHFVVSVAGRGFLDPFNHGRTLSREECLGFLQRSGRGRDESLLAETPDRFVLARMLANLHNVYKRRADMVSAERYRRLIDLFRGADPR